MKLTVIALAAIGAALAFAAPAHAQPGIVQMQLDSAAVMFRSEGLTRQDDYATGSLDQGESEEFELSLDGGKQYVIVGFCDGDCSDMDLELTTSGGDAVDSDFAEDDYPVVMVEPSRSATYNLRVVIAACSAEPCYYGVGVFARNQ